MKGRGHGDIAILVLRMALICHPVERRQDIYGHALCLGQEHLHLIPAEMVKSLEFQKILNAKHIKEGKSDIPSLESMEKVAGLWLIWFLH